MFGPASIEDSLDPNHARPGRDRDIQKAVDFDTSKFIDFLFCVFSYETDDTMDYSGLGRNLDQLKDVIERGRDEYQMQSFDQHLTERVAARMGMRSQDADWPPILREFSLGIGGVSGRSAVTPRERQLRRTGQSWRGPQSALGRRSHESGCSTGCFSTAGRAPHGGRSSTRALS